MKRVVSLVPAATEMVAALGGASLLVGVSHECDYPPAVQALPRVTATPIDSAASSAGIDAAVRALREAGRPVILVDATALRQLAPDLIIVQGLCDVCAVAGGEVRRLAAALDPRPEVVNLEAGDLAGIWADIHRVAAALDLEPEADELVAGLQSRLRRLGRIRGHRAPRVLCIEWLEPLFLAGHWVPELVDAVGGDDVGATPGSPSRERSWEEAESLRPDVVIVMLCGFDERRAERELTTCTVPAARRFLGSIPVWILDGNAYSSRPGPRVVDGAERIRAALEARELPGIRRWEAT